MSEKRFIVEYGENNLPFFADLEEHRDMSIKEVVDLLNEQQYQIDSLIVDKRILVDNVDKARLYIKAKDRCIKHQQATINKLNDENEQLKVLLKEAEDEIKRLKKTKQGLLESIVENDSNKAMILEFISNVRESEMCEGCKNKDKPVEWYLENGLSVTAGVCNRYEPED